MAHQIKFSKDGSQARVQLDFSSASMDLDLDAYSAGFVTLKNVIRHKSWVLQKRGSVKLAVASQSIGAGGVLAYYDGTLRNGTTQKPYYALADANNTAQVTGVPIVVNSTDGPQNATDPTGFPTMVGSDFLLCAGSFRPILMAGGTAHTPLSGASGVFTTGSTAVTGLAGMSTSNIGSLICNTQDSATTIATYQIVDCPTATTATLDRVYGGSRSTLASTWTARSVDPFRTGSTASGSSDGAVRAFTHCTMWQRIVYANCTSPVDGYTKPNMIRWGGLIGSTEGTSPYVGAYASHANGFIDGVSLQLGDILTITQHGDVLAVLHKRGLTLIHGAPTYSGIGSVDASMAFPSIGRYSARGMVSTPYGLFLYDSVAGLMVWRGAGRPEPVVPGRLTAPNLAISAGLTGWELGYYRDYVIITNATGALGSYMYHIPTQSLVNYTTGTLSYLQRGRDGGTAGTGDHYLVGMGSDNNGYQVMNLSNMFDNPGDRGVDDTLTTGNPFVVDMKTGKIGDPRTILRPTRMFVTYRATTASGLAPPPQVQLTLQSGMNDYGGASLWDTALWDSGVWDGDSWNAFTTSAGALPNTGDGIVTKVVELSLEHDPMVQVRALQVNAGSKFELYSIVIDCDVESEGPSR